MKELERLDSSDEFPQLVLASLLFREKKFLKCEELLKVSPSIYCIFPNFA